MATPSTSRDPRGLMPRLRDDLEALVRIPSISAPGRIEQPLLDAFELTSALFADAGVAVGRLDLPDTAPVVTGEIEAPPGAPTVLLYSHDDVVPAGDETQWSSPPYARAVMNVRVQQDAREAQDAVMRHLRAQRPFGIELDVRRGPTGDGFAAATGGPAYAAARTAWSNAWGRDVLLAGSGGSIPIVSALARALPEAEALLVGTTDRPGRGGVARRHPRGPRPRRPVAADRGRDRHGHPARYQRDAGIGTVIALMIPTRSC